MASALLLETESIRQTFREWHAEQESLDAQLTESLSALAAFQSHLDAWQRELAGERDFLRHLEDELAADRAALELDRAKLDESLSASAVEREEACTQVTALSASLAECTEELNSQKQRRDEQLAEIEGLRAGELVAKAAFDNLKQEYDLERSQWAEELRQVREDLERRDSSANASDREPPLATRNEPTYSAPTNDAILGESPVLESIVQQFGKLRQQRANDRESLRKAR